MSDVTRLYSPSQYNVSGLSPDESVEAFENSLKSTYEAVKRRVIGLRDVSYGSQKLDIWGGDSQTATHIFVYFHGGFFVAGSKEDAAPLVDLVVNGAGIPIVSVGYDLAPLKNLQEIVAQATEAVTFLLHRFPKAQFTLSGHSVGAYLAAAATTHLADASRIKQLLLIDGIYDLHDLVGTSYGDSIHLSSSDADSLSIDPGRLGEALRRRRVTLIIPEHTAPRFRSQSIKLQQQIIEASAHYVECEIIEIASDDHFTIIQNLTDRSGDPARHILRRLRFF